MIKLQGKYNFAVVYTDNIESKAISEITTLCNQEFTRGCNIRIMPDVHAGAGCTIGTTMTIKNKIVPSIVGYDICCGMKTVKLQEKHIDFALLDKIIRQRIPCGNNIRKTYHENAKKIDLSQLKCKDFVDIDRAMKSLGTLGGGNHFIEVDKDNHTGDLYIVIHSGSRHLGKQVGTYYQNLAWKELNDTSKQKNEIIKTLKAKGREQEIQENLKKIVKPQITKLLAYLEGDSLNDYLHDMKIMQQYANLNRDIMMAEILTGMGIKTPLESFTTLHNYVDLNTMILRKGAISAQHGEKVLIPMNMRDGSLICIGKGNPKWNYSAPHGAGRIMARGEAKENISIDDFIDSMTGIWTSSVNTCTIDEAPMAYKPMKEIIDNIGDTVNILKHIKPIYNFKSSI